MSIASFALVVALGAAPVQHGVIDGIVTDASLAPLQGAAVSILGSNVRVTTGADGRFRVVRLTAGHYLIAVHRLGYAPVSAVFDVAAEDTLRPSFALEPIASALDTMVVAAKSLSPKLAEFEERRRLGFGHFLTQTDIEKRIPVSLNDVLSTVPSVVIASDSIINRRDLPLRACGFLVYVDDVLLGDARASRLPRPSEVAGIEVYSGPSTTPLKYRSARSFCGAILIWTKDGSS